MNAHSLQSTRQSLLVYATLYPYLYGPRGAGPGHLPCPDIKGSEGPDPPCGNASPAVGRLPRHVSLSAHRYAFNPDVQGSYRYRVSTELINNPVNRPVNDQILEEFVEASPFVAWLEPGDGVGTVATLQARVPISARAMIPGIRKSVSAWLLARINRSELAACLAAGRATDWQEQFQGQGWLMLIGDEASSMCITVPNRESLLSMLQIEGVPAESHWFIRNRWHERVQLTVSQLPLTTDDIAFR